MAETWICNASPLILLGKIDRLLWLPDMCDQVIIPQAVTAEVRHPGYQEPTA